MPVVVAGLNFSPLGVFRRLDVQQLRNRRRDVDVVDFLEGSPLEIRSRRVENRFHLAQPRVVTVLAEKRRRLKEVPYGCSVPALKSR